MLLLSLLLQLPTTSGAPVPLEPSYSPAPLHRGTINLIYSCLVTYGICIWTAIHVDIVPYASRRDRFCYKILWAMCAVMLPEFLLIVAINQYRQARDLRNLWCTRFPDTMGLQGGFFLLMGGYTIRRGVATEKPEETVTLTPHGFKTILEMEDFVEVKEVGEPKVSIFKRIKSIPGVMKFRIKGMGPTENETKKVNLQSLATKCFGNPFAKEQIDDKGKADGISKMLVSCQALWMLLQCLGRKLNGLPVTLTEIHVAIQIVYSAFIYGFWWYKPLDVLVPIEICVSDDIWNLLENADQTDSMKEDEDFSDAVTLTEELIETESDQMASKPLTPAYQQEHPLIIENSQSNQRNMFYRVLHVVFENFVYNRKHTSEFAGMALSIINGALHATAWHSHFPTDIESLLWKISCLGMVVFPTVTYLATLSGDPVEAAIHAVWTLRFDDSRVDAPTYKNFRFARYTAARYIKAKYVGQQALAETEAPEWIWLFRVDVIFWMFYLYTVCILYFTVEAFVSIRSLPKGSYMLPQWSQLMPHI